MEARTKWKRILIGYSAALLVAAGGYVWGFGGLKSKEDQKPKTPRLKITRVSHDFGEVREGVILKHHFPVHNTGNAELQIYPEFSRQPIVVAPGFGTDIVVTLPTADVRKAQRVVRIRTNDPARPVVQLTVSAVVRD